MAPRIILVLIVLIGIGGIIIANYGIEKETLGKQDAENIREACGNCHRNPDRLDTTNVHNIHSGADCNRCHNENSSLRRANDVHDIIIWTGIVIFFLTVILLTTNYFMSKRRLVPNGEDSGNHHD